MNSQMACLCGRPNGSSPNLFGDPQGPSLLPILSFGIRRSLFCCELGLGAVYLPDFHPIFRAFPNMPLVSISDDQRGPMPPSLNWMATITPWYAYSRHQQLIFPVSSPMANNMHNASYFSYLVAVTLCVPHMGVGWSLPLCAWCSAGNRPNRPTPTPCGV